MHLSGFLFSLVQLYFVIFVCFVLLILFSMCFELWQRRTEDGRMMALGEVEAAICCETT